MSRAPESWRCATGGRIERDQPLPFTFNGTPYVGLRGDTLASALLANGVRVVGRSFKYHRPRGVLTAGIEEPNAIVQLTGADDEPNVIATALELRPGLQARSVNSWPSLRWDLGAVNDRLHPLLTAGFYYKTFLWPSWNFYGPFIRRAAGLSHAPERHSTEDRYEKRYGHCDLLIVGAGPAGLAAALTAARSGARVMLVDSQSAPGGQIANFTGALGEAPEAWVRNTVDELRASPRVMHLQRAVAAGYYDHNMVYVVEREPPTGGARERLWRVRARRVILATGAIERPLTFADNDRPGIQLASAAATYAQRYAVRTGRRAVFVTNNDCAYDAAFMLADRGTEVAAIVDLREAGPIERTRIAKSRDIEVLTGHTITAVRGRAAVRSLEVAPARALHDRRTIACDLIAVSGGWNPTVQLHAQSGGKPRYDAGIASFVPGRSLQQERSAGAAAGHHGIAQCIREGAEAAAQATAELGFKAPSPVEPPAAPDWNCSIQPVWQLPGMTRRKAGRAFVDFGHDVTAGDVALALRENYESVELVKRYTTTGMAIDQGKLGNVNAIGLMASLKGKTPDAVGTTTFRPPFQPVSFGVWAGHDRGALVLPARRTPMTGWFEQAGAYFDEAGGLFRRPFHIPRPGESAHDAVCREALAVRNSVGIYDGTPLGKFELNGPDVVELLNRLYTNRWESLRIGMGRFGWMLREDGRLFDDGVTFRLGPSHYLMSTGSGTADSVYAHLERLLQCEWPDLSVFVTPVTEQWANMCVCGPRARDVLAKAGTDLDLRSEAFPFMGIRTGHVAGFMVRAARVSYTGELSFELNVRAREGLALWEALMQAGETFGMTPVGSQTSLLLRLEKGFVAAWAEGDGCITPSDAGLDWALRKDTTDYIGRRSLLRDRNVGGRRRHIVGLLPVDPGYVPPDGAPLINPDARDESVKMIGLVTAAGYSPSLKRSIALAQLEEGHGRMGERITISSIGRRELAEVVAPVFIDPEGRRMKS